jgi:hypothetical protein
MSDVESLRAEEKAAEIEFFDLYAMISEDVKAVQRAVASLGRIIGTSKDPARIKAAAAAQHACHVFIQGDPGFVAAQKAVARYMLAKQAADRGEKEAAERKVAILKKAVLNLRFQAEQSHATGGGV